MDETFDPYYKWLGIPWQEQPPNHYRLLGINVFEGDPDVIQTAADRQMAHVRTFQIGKNSEASQRLLNELSAALVCLRDPAKKAAYDQTLRAKLSELKPASQLSRWQLARGALRYYRAQAERFWLYQTHLQGLYWSLGLDIFREGRYRDRFSAYYDRLAAIAESIASLEQGGQPPAREPSSPRTMTDRVKALGRWAKTKLDIARQGRKRTATLRELGRAAYEIDGLAAGPPHLTEPLRRDLTRLARLRDEVLRLSSVPQGRLLSPQRLAWIVASVLAVAGMLYLLLR